jgi:hypothetical protein
MGFWEKVFKAAGSVMNEAARKANESAYRNHLGQSIGGRTVEEWDRMWQSVGVLADADLAPLNRSVGLYRAILHGQVMYIGRAMEWDNGGFRKRLSDYRRDSDSGRKHGSGQKMFAQRDELWIEVLVTGEDAAAADVARRLEPLFVGKYRPAWNVMFN